MTEQKILLNRFISFSSALLLSLTLLTTIYVPRTAAITNQVRNGKIAFESTRNSGINIWTANSDGSNPAQLSSIVGSDDPSWSPDGTKIAFVAQGGGDSEVFVMNADGTNTVQLTNNASFVDFDPTWSPDGTKIAFVSNREAHFEIYSMNADGSNQTRLTTTALGVSNDRPSWSPDGTKIAFNSNININSVDFTYNIWAMDADDGSNFQQLTDNNNYGTTFRSVNEYGPSWSPDGTKIAFESDSDGNFEIWTINALDGSGELKLTTTSSPVANSAPSWSPNGSEIAFQFNNGNDEIYTMLANGSSQTNRTNNAADDRNPSWQPVLTVNCSVSGGSNTCTIPAGENLGSTNFTVGANETLTVNGTAGNITVQSGGILKGSGGTVGAVTVLTGGKVAPGLSPGCLNTGAISFVSGSSLDVEIAGNTVCTQYDQLRVTGAVNLGGATLNTVFLNGFVPAVGNSYTIIDKIDAGAITGNFATLLEGASLTVGGITFRISYVGGNGNDVVLTVTGVTPAAAAAAPGAPNTGIKGILTSPLGGLSVIGLAVTIALLDRKYKLSARLNTK